MGMDMCGHRWWYECIVLSTTDDGANMHPDCLAQHDHCRSICNTDGNVQPRCYFLRLDQHGFCCDRIQRHRFTGGHHDLFGYWQ